MKKPVLRHRQELAEQGVEKTPNEVGEWFDDVTEFFRDGAQIDVPPEDLVEEVERLKEMWRPE